MSCSPSEVNAQPSKVCKRKSPPSKLSEVKHQLFVLLHLKSSQSKHKGFYRKELIMLRFLVMQFSLGSRNSSLLLNEKKNIFSSVFYTKKTVKKSILMTHNGERRGATPLACRGWEREKHCWVV